jgi:hypothetical protein
VQRQWVRLAFAKACHSCYGKRWQWRGKEDVDVLPSIEEGVEPLEVDVTGFGGGLGL